MEFTYSFNNQPTTVRVEKSDGEYIATVGDHTFAASARADECLLIEGGAQHRAYVVADGARRWVWVGGQVYVFALPEPGRRARPGRASGHDALEAGMPGVVRKILVQPGQAVERGQTLVLMEAMKMEIRLSAPHAGVVERIAVTEGQAVERGQVLVEVAPASPEA